MIKKIICETCDKYGDVHKVKLRKSGEVNYVCYECGSMWDENHIPLTIIMEEHLAKKCPNKKFEDAFEELE
jgi:uncharacterized Zn finger protein